ALVRRLHPRQPAQHRRRHAGRGRLPAHGGCDRLPLAARRGAGPGRGRAGAGAGGRELAVPITLFVNGTLMRGLALHPNLHGAEFLGPAGPDPRYRLYSIGDVHPGMFEVESGGVSVAGELYRLPDEVWARVEAGEPPNLYKGPVRLEDGRTVDGILYPRALAE